MKYLFSCLFLAAVSLLSAQPIVYKDAQTLVTGTWTGAGAGGTATLTEVTGETPHEGNKHYKFVYNFTQWWAGYGLNMDNWGSGAARNFSGYTHLRIAYRGLSSGQTLQIQLRDGANFGNQMDIGTSNGSYQVVELSMSALTIGSPVSANAVREIDISVASSTQTGSGTVYVDAIELVNNAGNAPAAASAATNARAASLGGGINTSNWLEAYWLMPFNAYPEVNRYTRTKVRDLHDAGFSTFRLPVTFERLGSTAPPYDLDFNHTAFDLVDSMILWAGIYNFKLIIDNHHGYALTNSNYATELPRLQAVWQQLTDRYDYLDPNQFFFEIYNEPTNDITNANWRTVAESLIATIRANESQTHSVLVGGNGWNSGNGLLTLTPLSDPDIIYTFHCYDPYFFTHQGMSWTSPPYLPAVTFPQAGDVAALNSLFASLKTWGDNYSVPVNLGEFGCSTAADATSRCNWINAITNAIYTNNFSYFYWDAITPSDAFGFYTGGVISSSTCIPCFKTALGLYVSLPLVLNAFEVQCAPGKVTVDWSAYADADGLRFVVEKSNNGVDWKIATALTAKPGDHHYHWEEALNGKAYYRLKMEDVDGDIKYSPVLPADCISNRKVKLSPNPAGQWTTLSLEAAGVGLAQIEIYDLSGRLLDTHRFEKGTLQQQFQLPLRQYAAGLYEVRATATDGAVEVLPLVILAE